jgi:hypothetical protein
MNECKACGEGPPFIVNAYGLCAFCEDDYWISPESRSVVTANIMWREAGCPSMSDPWDRV